ncbi:MAG TPA: hypothetical protein VKH81_02910 [Candidatus Angelobacter sp.]|nr:hypothetical protein [Candidatus Angelobacter sp.]
MTTERHLRTDTNELVSHLKDLTNALNALHGDLYWLAMQAPESAEKPSLPAAELDVDLLAGLKSAVDDMRLLLWQYLEAASVHDPQCVRDGIEAQRLQRVTKFLQLLRDRLSHSPVSEQQPLSFIERISAAVKKSLDEKAA